MCVIGVNLSRTMAEYKENLAIWRSGHRAIADLAIWRSGDLAIDECFRWPDRPIARSPDAAGYLLDPTKPSTGLLAVA